MNHMPASLDQANKSTADIYTTETMAKESSIPYFNKHFPNTLFSQIRI